MSNFTPEEYRLSRRRIIESILATDMAFHQRNYSSLKTKCDTLDIKKGKNLSKLLSDDVNKTFENQQTILDFILHSSDISAPGKMFKICDKWKHLVYEEFFKQGDLEKDLSLPITMLCDRQSINSIKSQLGFIQYIVSPTFELLINIFPELNTFMQNINSNSKKYHQFLIDDAKK
jgi:calcium/calmodulin-dependent 3',5'-cyclic nucleotide phosphodiesterase